MDQSKTGKVKCGDIIYTISTYHDQGNGQTINLTNITDFIPNFDEMAELAKCEALVDLVKTSLKDSKTSPSKIFKDADPYTTGTTTKQALKDSFFKNAPKFSKEIVDYLLNKMSGTSKVSLDEFFNFTDSTE